MCLGLWVLAGFRNSISYYYQIVFFSNTIFHCLFLLLHVTDMLNLKSADEYKYLQQSNCYSITGVNDAEEFHVVKVVFLI